MCWFMQLIIDYILLKLLIIPNKPLYVLYYVYYVYDLYNK